MTAAKDIFAAPVIIAWALILAWLMWNEGGLGGLIIMCGIFPACILALVAIEEAIKGLA